MTGAGVGWLQGTIQGVDADWLQALIASRTEETPESRPGGTRWYAESATVGRDVLVAWAPRVRPDRREVYFEVRQTGLDALGADRALDLAWELTEGGATFTRADVYLDDRERRATPSVVAEAFQQGQVVTHVKRIRRVEEFARQAKDEAVLDGATTYLGSPKSLGMVRVYDKAAESGRPGAGVRWEYQARGDHAERLVWGAVAMREELGSFVLGCVRALVDFRDRRSVEHGDRAPELAWWTKLLADATRVSLTGPARVDSLERRATWIRRQAAPTLALLTAAYGPGWLKEVLAEGDRRLTEEDRERLLRRPERPRVLP